MRVVKPAPPPVHVDEAETIRVLVDGPDEDRPCMGTIGGNTCAIAAVWCLDCTNCGLFGQACDGHRDWADRRNEHGALFVCTRCRVPFPKPLPWVPL